MASYQPVDLAYNYIEPQGCLLDKAPIIFMHGVTSTKEYWKDIPDTAANATKRKTYVVDARNHGDSPWTDYFNFDVNADDLLKFMDTINAPTAILVGHSMGGIAAIKASLKAPERVEKLIVEDIGVRKTTQDRINVIVVYLTVAQLAIQQVPPTLNEAEAKKFIIDAIFRNIPQELVAMHKLQPPEYNDNRIQLKRTESGAYAYKSNIASILNALKDAPSLIGDYAGEYRGPSSFIYGTLSPVNVGSDKEEIRKYIPHAEFTAIEGASHLVHTDHPKEFTETLLQFLLK